MKERRSKVFWVDEGTIFFLFVEFTKSPTEFVSIPTPINLPEGAIVEYCRHDPWRRGFAFVVSHPSFPIWEDGAECPRGDDVLDFTTTRRLVKPDNGGVFYENAEATIGVDIAEPWRYMRDKDGNITDDLEADPTKTLSTSGVAIALDDPATFVSPLADERAEMAKWMKGTP